MKHQRLSENVFPSETGDARLVAHAAVPDKLVKGADCSDRFSRRNQVVESYDLEAIAKKADEVRSGSSKRALRFETGGRSFWVKQIEQPRFLRRLLKGEPRAAFDREISALRFHLSQATPVPDIVLARDDYVVLVDAGASVEALIRGNLVDLKTQIEICEQAGLALQKLHASGLTHGRPVLRDICWDEKGISFLDLENYNPDRNNPKGYARDLICFVHSLYSQDSYSSAAVEAAVSAYRSTDQQGVWEIAALWVSRHRWIDWVTRPIQLRRPPHAREFKALPLVVAEFSRG